MDSLHFPIFYASPNRTPTLTTRHLFLTEKALLQQGAAERKEQKRKEEKDDLTDDVLFIT